MIDIKNYYKLGFTGTVFINNPDKFISTKGQEGLDQRYYRTYDESLLVSDSLSELTKIIKAKPTNTISPGDKIYFAKNVDYPVLLLSRLKSQYSIDISRTTTESKADKFIVNKIPIECVSQWKSSCALSCIHLTGLFRNQRLVCSIPNTTDLQKINYIKQNVEKLLNITLTFAQPIDNPESAQIFITHQSNCVIVPQLIKYTNQFIPSVTDSELKAAFSYLKSSDDSIRLTGINLFEYFNIGDKIYDVIKGLHEVYETGCYLIPNSSKSCTTPWKYLLQSIDCNILDIQRNFDNNQSYFLRKILANPIYTGDMESIKKEIKTRLLERLLSSPEFSTLREDLDIINCELVLHDKNGETDSGN